MHKLSGKTLGEYVTKDEPLEYARNSHYRLTGNLGNQIGSISASCEERKKRTYSNGFDPRQSSPFTIPAVSKNVGRERRRAANLTLMSHQTSFANQKYDKCVGPAPEHL